MTRRVALVTGGAAGIGRALVRRLAADGLDVVVADVDAAAGEESAREAGGRFAALDVGEPADWDRLAAGLDRLDVAFLNAGLWSGSTSFLGTPLERYRELVRVNVDGVVLGVRALVPALSQARGAIVVTASIAGIEPIATDPVYTLTKHAAVGLVRSVAPELRRRDVRINAVCPTYTDTAFLGRARAYLAAVGYPLLAAEAVAAQLAEISDCETTGDAWVVTPVGPSAPFRFPEPVLPTLAGR